MMPMLLMLLRLLILLRLLVLLRLLILLMLLRRMLHDLLLRFLIYWSLSFKRRLP
jgi:hypothetical protein